MSLTRISMRVEPGAGSVAAARRWVVSACLGIGRPELAECAALGVSELVTNALLHARPPIIVSLGGSLDHPRIEVADCSTVPPLRRITDDPLSTTGRGIELVSMCSSMWGVEIDGAGKVVWFEPARDSDASRVPPYTFHQTAPPQASESDGGYPVTVREVQVRRCQELQAYYREISRELRLLSITREHEYPLATQLTTLFSNFDDVFPTSVMEQIQAAADQGLERIDVRVSAPPSLPDLIPQILEVLELAESFSRAQRLLTGGRTSDQAEYCQWFFQEFRRQSVGLPPLGFEETAAEQSAS